MREKAVMTAVVATLVIVPLGVLFAGVCTLVFGASPYGVVTFGGTFSGPLGLLAWWMLSLVPAAIYVAFCSHHE